MYCYKSYSLDGYSYYGGDMPPKNTDGLIEITQEEFEKAIAELEAEEQFSLAEE